MEKKIDLKELQQLLNSINSEMEETEKKIKIKEKSDFNNELFDIAQEEGYYLGLQVCGLKVWKLLNQ